MHCPACGAEIFYDEKKEEQNVAHTCWNCGAAVSVPAKLNVGKQKIVLMADSKLYRHHIYGDYDMNTVVGSVVQNPKNPNLWGIRNEDQVNWTYIKADGTQLPVAVGRSAGIAKGVKINFGQNTGEFR